MRRSLGLIMSDDKDEWVTLSFEDLGVEIITFVLAAKDMVREEDTMQMHKPTGDWRIKEDMMRRIMEVNQMASELLELMHEKGKSEGEKPSA
jgi:hypothetical protein